MDVMTNEHSSTSINPLNHDHMIIIFNMFTIYKNRKQNGGVLFNVAPVRHMDSDLIKYL